MNIKKRIKRIIRGTDIVVFANCQGRAIVEYLKRGLTGGRFRIRHFRNSQRMGKMKPPEVIVDAITNADIAIIHPLKKNHGILSYEYIRSVISPDTLLISVPYVVNTGVYSLCFSPHSKGMFDYGRIHGEDIIIEELRRHGLDGVIKRYQACEIDFCLKDRFSESLNTLKKNESLTDITVSDFIQDNMNKKLFLTFNHPSSTVMLHIMEGIKILTGLPLRTDLPDFQNENFARFPTKNALISPYDVEVHGYNFDPTPDWMEKGVRWIKMIAEAYDRILTKKR
jgi:hypothetical protein